MSVCGTSKLSTMAECRSQRAQAPNIYNTKANAVQFNRKGNASLFSKRTVSNGGGQQREEIDGADVAVAGGWAISFIQISIFHYKWIFVLVAVSFDIDCAGNICVGMGSLFDGQPQPSSW